MRDRQTDNDVDELPTSPRPRYESGKKSLHFLKFRATVQPEKEACPEEGFTVRGSIQSPMSKSDALLISSLTQRLARDLESEELRE